MPALQCKPEGREQAFHHAKKAKEELLAQTPAFSRKVHRNGFEVTASAPFACFADLQSRISDSPFVSRKSGGELSRGILRTLNFAQPRLIRSRTNVPSRPKCSTWNRFKPENGFGRYGASGAFHSRIPVEGFAKRADRQTFGWAEFADHGFVTAKQSSCTGREGSLFSALLPNLWSTLAQLSLVGNSR